MAGVEITFPGVFQFQWLAETHGAAYMIGQLLTLSTTLTGTADFLILSTNHVKNSSASTNLRVAEIIGLVLSAWPWISLWLCCAGNQLLLPYLFLLVQQERSAAESGGVLLEYKILVFLSSPPLVPYLTSGTRHCARSNFDST